MTPPIPKILGPENAINSLREIEELFSTAFWLSPDCVSLVRASDGALIKANAALCRLWKTNPEDVAGKTSADYSTWVNADEQLGFVGALKTDGGCFDHEATLLLKDGREVVFKLSARLVTFNNESCILNVLRDITQERMIGLALKKSEVRYRRLFETAKDGILILDEETGMVMDANPFLVELLGFSHAEFLGKAVWELGFFKDVDANEAMFEELRANGYVRYEHLPLETAGGQKIDVEFVSNVYLVEGEKVVQCNIRDVTARRKAEAAVLELNSVLELRVIERTAELERANQELEAFSYSVSHDLRAPLRAIDGFSQAVLEDYGPQLRGEGKRYLETIRAGAHQMGTLIDDLLKFSRLGRELMNKQTFATTNLVRSALEGLGSLRKDREVEVHLADLPDSHGDPALLKQVWINLLSNALKYTRNRECAVIEIGSMQDHGETIFFVRDNGTGFDMRYVDKLFGVFQRLHRTEDYEGTGVGLAICQRIIHRHGGRIWAVAVPDAGATFFFTLEKATTE